MEPQSIKSEDTFITGDEIPSLGLQVTILFTFLFLFTMDASSQKIWEARKGCVSTQGNFAGGYLFGIKKPSAYLQGDVEIFLEDRVAVNGAAWYSFALNRKTETGIKANHGIFFGLNYHFLKPKRFDPFIGITPGVGLVQVAFKDADELKRTPYTIVPLISADIGFNYYVGSIFHFFVKMQGISGQVFANLPSPMRLDELKFTGGLGWNFRMWKPKVKDN